MSVTVHISEAEYVDPRAGNDKFYRTFVIESLWITQYGRNGTAGTFTKLVDAGTPEAAQKAADAKFLSKTKKGYRPSRSGQVPVAGVIDADNVSVLDDIAAQLPAGTAGAVISKPAEAVDLGGEKLSDLTAEVTETLSVFFGDALPDAASTDPYAGLPIRPMLASVQAPELIEEALQSEDWIAQYKYDGDRLMVVVENGEIRTLNRQGEEKVRNVARKHLTAFTALHSGTWVFDGEIVGRTLVLFDLVKVIDGAGTVRCRESDVTLKRQNQLHIVGRHLGFPYANEIEDGTEHPVVLAPFQRGTIEKQRMLDTAIAEKREGLILRHIDAVYEPARRSTMLVKHKFIKDVDVVVTALHDTKDSATLSVYDRSGSLVEVGRASTIGKGQVSVGDVWVVTFLYVVDPAHPRMVQPRLVSSRTDKRAAECLLDQFADAGTARIV